MREFENKLVLGYWGSNEETYAYHSGKYQVYIDDGNFGKPIKGGKYLMGLYLLKRDGSEDVLISSKEGKNFDLKKIEKECPSYIHLNTRSIKHS